MSLGTAVCEATCSCGLEMHRVTAFAAQYYAEAPREFRLHPQPLSGGLSASVVRVRVRFLKQRRLPRTAAFVVKRVKGGELREIRAFESLLSSSLQIAPRLLGADHLSEEEAYLYLEWIHSSKPWPWADMRASGLVIEALAQVHQLLPPRKLPGWDYDDELMGSARATLELVEMVARNEEYAAIRPFLPATRRLVLRLPTMRAQILNGPWPLVTLHGDMHPGNALIRLVSRRRKPVLLDWGRIRAGSALEDVCSWLQSLGYWEPEAKRRHDTLLRRYLAARGLSTVLGPSFRELYWLAGASNGLAGALRYHVFQMANTENPLWVREGAAAAVRDWLRILARADASWRN